MNNSLLQLKVKERVNKLDSADYSDIDPWMIVEAFNKAQSAWTRRQLEGINQTKAGNEGSRRRIDDLQVILTTVPLPMNDKGIYWESPVMPVDYMEWCRISASAKDICCPSRPLIIFEGEEADRDILLMDSNRQPSFAWRTTFATILSNTIRIYTNDEFDIVDPEITYYRQPRNIQIAGVANPYTGMTSVGDVLCEYKDNIVDLIIDEAAALIAGDIADYNNTQRLNQLEERSN